MTETSTLYRVELAPEGGDVEFVGDFSDLTEARAACTDESPSLPQYLWDTARAAGSVCGMSAPEGGPDEDAEPMEWIGDYAITRWQS